MPWTDRDLVLRRVVAFVIDAFVVAGAVGVLVTRLVGSRRWRLLATALLAGAVGIPYHVLLEGTFGRTVGKGVSGIRVVSEDGGRCTYPAATARTILRFVDWLPAAYLVGLLSMALTERDQRLGDLVGGTVVVGTRRGERWGPANRARRFVGQGVDGPSRERPERSSPRGRPWQRPGDDATETSQLSVTESDVEAMFAILVGPDRSLEAALQAQGVETVRLAEHATGDSLADAGVADADLLVVTDVAEATAIPVSKDVNPDLRVVIYASETMPEFARGQVDLAVAPGVLDADVIAEELADASADGRSGGSGDS